MNKFLCFVFFLLFASLVSAVGEDYFTRHSELTELHLALDLGNSGHFVNDFGEKEFFFDSMNQKGEIMITPAVGSVLVRDLHVVKVRFNPLKEEEVPSGFDNSPFIDASEQNGKITLRYNIFSPECGGNYALVFAVSNPVEPGVVKVERLRLHVPCYADLMIVLSSLMGEPSTEFLAVAREYVDAVAGQRYRVRFIRLSASDLSLTQAPYYEQSATGEEIEEALVLRAGGYGLIGEAGLKARLLNSFRFDHGIVTNSPFLEFSDKSSVLLVQPLEIPQQPGQDFNYFVQSESGKFSGEVKTSSASLIDTTWYVYEVAKAGEVFHDFFSPETCNEFTLAGISGRPNFPAFFGKPCTFIGGALPKTIGSTNSIDGYDVKLVEVSRVKMLQSLGVEIQGNYLSYKAISKDEEAGRAQKVKKKLDFYRQRFQPSPQMIMLVGSVEHIPMPFLKDVQSTSGKGEFIGSHDGNIPSDSLYVFDSETRSLYPLVARLPVALDDPEPWKFVSKILRNSLKAREKIRNRPLDRIYVVSDACGKENDCYIYGDTEQAAALFWKPCKGNSACLLSAPNCQAISSQCTGISKILNVVKTGDALFVNAHGSGNGFYARTAEGRTLVIFSAADLHGLSNPGLMVLISSCYGGSIDVDADGEPITKRDSTAFAFLEVGAPLVIGHTRFSRGVGKNNSGLLAFDFSLLKAIKEKDPNFAEGMYKYRFLLQSPIHDAYKFAILSRQVYGDPLLPLYSPS